MEGIDEIFWLSSAIVICRKCCNVFLSIVSRNHKISVTFSKDLKKSKPSSAVHSPTILLLLASAS